MSLKSVLMAGLFAAALSPLAPAAPAEAKTFRYAFQGDLNSLDPYTLNESFALSTLNVQVYEGLVRRDESMKLVPALAEKWEMAEPTRWRFYLRKGVKFQGGEDFTADDVIFSLDRVRAEGSELKTRVPADMKAVKIDDYTVDFVLKEPNPILINEWETWAIMSKKWAESVGAVKPQAQTGKELSAVAFKANGTGPFSVASHEAGVKTVYKLNANWWDIKNKKTNVDEVVFTTIKAPATRVAALLSGEVDLIEPVPVQDMQRVADSSNAYLLTGPELRTIHLYYDIKRDELLYSSVKGKNPFKDIRVRKAFNMAIDIEAIKTKVMRNLSAPTAAMISPIIFPPAGTIKRWPYDPKAAKDLLTEAGYPNGFELTMHCPNDRYVNDEAICQAAASMLARIGVKVNLQAIPKAQFFAKAGASGPYDTSFGMLGWTPDSLDPYNVLLNIMGCRDDKGIGGPFNYGGYCSPTLDALSAKVLVENDTAKRDAMMLEALKIAADEAGFIPLHQQSLAWGVSKKVKIPLRANNFIMYSWVMKED